MTAVSADTTDLLQQCEPWIVLATGVFITCCRSGNFSPVELARQPAIVKGRLAQGIAEAGAPGWFPVDDAIFQSEDGSVYCRVGDLPAQKRVQPIEGKNQHINLDLRRMTAVSGNFSLVYFPWFRFLAEPVNFDATGRVAGYIADCLLFLLKKWGAAPVLVTEDNAYRLDMANGLSLTLIGQAQLDRLVLAWQGAQTVFDAAGRSIEIDSRMFPAAYQAAAQIVSEGDRLDNAIVSVAAPRVTLRHAPGAGHV